MTSSPAPFHRHNATGGDPLTRTRPPRPADADLTPLAHARPVFPPPGGRPREHELVECWADERVAAPQGRPPTVLPVTSALQKPSALPPTMRTTMIGVDIPTFGDRRRDADVQRSLRTLLYQHLRESFETTGLPWWDCHREDRGDGALVVLPPQAPASRVLEPLAHHLAARLCRSNKLASDIGRLRLRMAVHVGEVQHDAHGVLGQPLIHLFRLLEAPAFKKAARDADLGVLISRQLYEEVAASGRLNADAYLRLPVRHKETRTVGHLWLPPRYHETHP